MFTTADQRAIDQLSTAGGPLGVDADGANGVLMRSVADDCARHHLLLIVEALVYRLDDESDAAYADRRGDLIREAGLLAAAAGARYLKLEYPGSERDCARLTDELP